MRIHIISIAKSEENKIALIYLQNTTLSAAIRDITSLFAVDTESIVYLDEIEYDGENWTNEALVSEAGYSYVIDPAVTAAAMNIYEQTRNYLESALEKKATAELSLYQATILKESRRDLLRDAKFYHLMKEYLNMIKNSCLTDECVKSLVTKDNPLMALVESYGLPREFIGGYEDELLENIIEYASESN